MIHSFFWLLVSIPIGFYFSKERQELSLYKYPLKYFSSVAINTSKIILNYMSINDGEESMLHLFVMVVYRILSKFYIDEIDNIFVSLAVLEFCSFLLLPSIAETCVVKPSLLWQDQIWNYASLFLMDLLFFIFIKDSF